MQTIKDSKDQEWTIHLNAGEACDRILAATGVDLLEPEKDEAAGVIHLATSTRAAMKAVWALVTDEARERGYETESEYFSNFERPLVFREALAKEIENFIQHTDPLAADRLEQAHALNQVGQEEVAAVIQSPEFHDQCRQEIREKVRQKLTEAVSEIVSTVGEN